MNGQERIEELLKAANIPGGLQTYGAYIILSLLTDPEIMHKTVKDINEMSDKFVFFYKDQVIFELNIPWHNSLESKRKELTGRYKFLLESKE